MHARLTGGDVVCTNTAGEWTNLMFPSVTKIWPCPITTQTQQNICPGHSILSVFLPPAIFWNMHTSATSLKTILRTLFPDGVVLVDCWVPEHPSSSTWPDISWNALRSQSATCIDHKLKCWRFIERDNAYNSSLPASNNLWFVLQPWRWSGGKIRVLHQHLR